MKKEKIIEIKPLVIKEQMFTIKGTSPLIVHAWSHKAKQQILDKQMKKKTGAKHDIKNPVLDFMESLYWIDGEPAILTDRNINRDSISDEEAMAAWEEALNNGAKFGFPATGIKQSIIMGAKRAGMDVVGTEMKGTFFISGATDDSTMELAEIVTPEPPAMREDMVMVGGMSKSADLRYRPEFAEWEIPLKIKYNAEGKYSLEQILNCVNAGGFACGIGEWRPERDGQFGMYELKTN